jgi:hypothetical protein
LSTKEDKDKTKLKEIKPFRTVQGCKRIDKLNEDIKVKVKCKAVPVPN